MAQRSARGRRTHLIERGDIVVVELDPTAGHEQRGRRPVIVITPAPFNALGLALVAPITSGGGFARHRGFAVELAGAKTSGVILCNQLRTLDLTARGARFVERAPAGVVEDMLARIRTLVD
ncbi:MAG TPA: type II toxin-antitoxin system ChpB family toxin [Terricaulis sp.]|nr:type II toxin-antitoxin system ChpB family toxin [Terricaulis sp.]HRP11746.1 type II toxin-antitoxin system ChpB family toxin [Terricaulis sp.]